ncbi:ParB/RepB/Spo0J family partition protein [Litorimonas sp. RW-G-Af-16]|uniref:ParB/RepB/Spo0J family partition protein n=1 Tax=Litorimonas sp. RW-G-Af-16 TaxID=3241168 RepID=UPI00390C79CF
MSKSPKTPKSKALKKASQRGLGRGLSALMSDVSAVPDSGSNKGDEAQTATSKAKPKPKSGQSKTTVKKTTSTQPKGQGVSSLPIDRLDRNPDQPRKYFDKAKLEELTQSIKDKGVLQPILVRPISKAGTRTQFYQIVAGERRWQAALKAGLTAMPALVRDLSDQEVLEIGVVENVQRADLNPIEEALAYHALSEDFNRTQADIAQAVGKSRPHIANMLRLLTLPKRAQTYLAQGKITTGHARAIISAPDPVELADAIAGKGLSVREAEDWVRRIKSSKSGNSSPSARAYKDADTRKVEDTLTQALGLTTDLRHKGPSGELRIKYKTSAQLEELIKRLSRA